MSRRFARAGWPGSNEYAQGGPDLVASATPHTVGAWSVLDAAVAADACGITIASLITIGTSNTDTSMLLELGFGAASSEVSKVQVFVGGNAVSSPIYLPLHIPAGTRLSGRIQGAIASDTYEPAFSLDYYDPRFGHRGYQVAEAIGLDTASSSPTAGNLTNNAWEEVVASTANPYKALTVHLGIPGNNSSQNTMSVDVGVGAAAAEQQLGSIVCRTSSGEVCTSFGYGRFIEANIAAGSRLSLRKNGNTNLTGHVIGWR